MKLKLFIRSLVLLVCATAPVTHAQGQSAYKSRAEAIAGTSDNANSFAKDLYNVLERQGNIVVSPVSVFTALSMASAGAKGQTQAQILHALYTTPDSLTRSPGMADFIANFKDPDSTSVVKEMANFMWVPRGVSIKPDFARTMQEVFQTRVRDADFSRSEDVRQLVNNRISNFTRGKIQELLPRGSITPQTRLLMANAVYFKGQWAVPFDSTKTRNDPFVYDPVNSRSTLVPTMRTEDIFRAAIIDELDSKAVLLPYDDNRHGLLILLPNRYDGLYDLEEKMIHTRYTTSRIMQNLIHRGVNLTLPRFQIKYDTELSNNLQRLGITDLFSDNADLSGMSSLALRSRLRASGFFHQATIEVNEGGSEASAASGMEITPLMGTTGYTGPIEFKADHPFMFFMIDEINGNVPIFMGRVTQPGNREVAKPRTEDFELPASAFPNRNRYTPPPPTNDNSLKYTGRPHSTIYSSPVRTTRPSYDEIIFPQTEDPYHRASLPVPYRRFDNPLRTNNVYPDYLTATRDSYEPILYPNEDEFESSLAKRRKREALPWAWPADPAAQKWPAAASDGSSNDTIDDRGKKDWHKQPPLVDLLIPVNENPQASRPSFQPQPGLNIPNFEAAPSFPAVQAGNRFSAPQAGPPSGFANNFGNPGWPSPPPNFPATTGFGNPFPSGNFPYPGFAPTQSSFVSGGPGNPEPFLPLQPGPNPHSPTLGPNAIIFPDPAVRIQPSKTGSSRT